MRNLQRGIADFSCLFAEDGAQKAFFCGQFCFALRCDLTDKIVAGCDFCTDADDAVLVEILECVLADIRDIAGDLLHAEFGVAGFRLILFNMNGGEDVLADEAFVQQNGVFVVVAFPRHEADKHVLASPCEQAGPSAMT